MPGMYSWVPGIQGAVKPPYEPILFEQVYRRQGYPECTLCNVRDDLIYFDATTIDITYYLYKRLFIRQSNIKTLDKLNTKESILYDSLVTCKGVGSGESLKRIRRIRRIQRLQRTPEHGRQIILRKHITFSGSQAGMPAVNTAPWMPGTQLYTPGIHRADLKNNPFQPYP